MTARGVRTHTSVHGAPPLPLTPSPSGGEGECLIGTTCFDGHRVGRGTDARSWNGAARTVGVRVAGRVSPLPPGGGGVGGAWRHGN